MMTSPGAGRGLLATLLLFAGGLPLFARSPEPRPSAPEILVRIVSSANGRGLAGASLTIEEGASHRFLLADERGELRLPGLGGLASSGRRPVLVARSPGHLSCRRAPVLDGAPATLVFELAALSTARRTPLLRAGHAAAVALPGLGRLEVAAGALAADARLEILPVAPRQLGEPPGDWDLCAAVHLAVRDGAGRPANHLLSSVADSIRLTVAPWSPRRLPREARVWDFEALELDADHAVVARRSCGATRLDRIAIPLRPGLNLVHLAYFVEDGLCRRWGPWTLEMLPIGGHGERRVPITISCGYLGASGSVRVSHGETVTNRLGVSATASAEVGWEAGALFGKVSAKIGLQVTGSFERATTRTRLVESSIGTPATGTANGAPGAQLAPPWSCLDGTYVLGFVDRRYACYARRVCLDDASVVWQLRALGEIVISEGLRAWYEDLHWNPACPGCQGGGEVPAVEDPNFDQAPDLTQLVPH